jgi:hypothetical protein
MLSFIYRLIKTFQREHGLHPNLVYLNRQHYQKLLKSLPTMKTHEEISRFLMMEIVISPEIAHPHVACANMFGGNLPQPPSSRTL